MTGRTGALVGALSLVLLARIAGAATVSVGELGLPDPKAGGSELRHSLGKNWQAACRAEIEGGLGASKAFDRVVPTGGDVVLVLVLERAERTLDDRRLEFGGGATMSFQGVGRWSWTQGQASREGRFDVSQVQKIDREPNRADLENGWREILRKAVMAAVADGRPEDVAAPRAPDAGPVGPAGADGR